MKTGWLIVDVMYLLICGGVVIYTNSGTRAGQPQPRWAKVVWVFLGLTSLGRLVYDLLG
jgi:hypothetical protein